MSDSFDPFDLPSSFDPLGSDGPPPPRQRRGFAAAKTEPPVNPRLAHLLPQAAPPAAAAIPSGTASDGADTSARLATLEDEVAILTDRLNELTAVIDDKLEGHQDRLLRAVAGLVAQRR